MMELPEPKTARKPPYWEYWRHELWQHVVDGADPQGFMGWPCIYHTMLVNHWKDAVAVEFEAVRGNARWLAAIIMPEVGQPPDFHNWTVFSRNLIHQAYHLSRWEAVTGRHIEDLNTIVEFGGGYGAMALVARRAGFQGTYVIYDLPEFTLLQQWFLSRVSVQGVEWPEDIEPIEADLLIGLYSLSETPMDVRQMVLDSVTAQSFLFLYSATWEHYDNSAWFRSLNLTPRFWHHEEIEHLPDRGNWYTIGW